MISKKLKHLREYYGLTMRELAEHMNTTQDTRISASMISSWENGRYNPSLKTLQTYSSYFDVKMEYFTSDDIPIDSYPTIDSDNERIYKSEKESLKNILDGVKKLNFLGLYRVEEFTRDMLKIPMYQAENSDKLIKGYSEFVRKKEEED